MIFIHPMWDSENQRLGLRQCTPLGYALVGIGDVIGMLLGLLTLASFCVYLVYKLIAGQFYPGLLWLLLIPIAFGVLGRVLFAFGWLLARRKGFRYDSARIAWWTEGGEIHSYPPKGEAVS